MGKTFRLTVNDKTYDVEVGDLSQSPVDVRVDGEKFSVTLEGAVPEVDRGPMPVMSMAHNPVAPPPPAPVPDAWRRRTRMDRAGSAGKHRPPPSGSWVPGC